MKRVWTALCICTVLAAMLALGTSALDGKCGKDLTWTLAGGTLTISGTGAMEDYESRSGTVMREDGILDVSGEKYVKRAPWYSDRLSVKTVIVEKGVTSIGDAAFASCTKLASVQLPEGLQSIGESAFLNCSDLEEIVLPDSLLSLGEACFFGSDLKAVTLPKNVRSIGARAFSKTKLTAFSVDAQNTHFCAEDGLLLSADRSKLYCYPAARKETVFILPDYITHIMQSAFAECNTLRTIVLHENVVTIEDKAFNPCQALGSIYIPAGVQTLGSELFSANGSLTIYSGDSSKVRRYATANGISFTTNKMPDNIFTWTVDASGTLTVQGNGCIAKDTFEGSPWKDQEWKITSLSFSEGVTKIDGYTFQNLSNVKEIVLPASLQEISGGPFRWLTGLESISVDKKNNYFCVQDGVLFDSKKVKLFLYPAQKPDDTYTLPKSVTEIADYAFANAPVQAVYFPFTLSSVGTSPFSGCDWLAIASFGDGAKRAFLNAFLGCNVQAVYIPGDVAGLTYMGYKNLDTTIYSSKANLLDNLSGTRYVKQDGNWVPTTEPAKNLVESSVTSQGFAFTLEEMPKISFSWTLKDGVLTVSGVGRMPDYTKGNAPWEDKKETIHTVIVEEGITKVGNYAFYGCTALDKVKLPYTLLGIGDAAFAYCTELTEIRVPEKIKHFGAAPFYGCESLSNLRIEVENKIFSSRGGAIYDKAMRHCLWDTKVTYCLADAVRLLESFDRAERDRAVQMLQVLAW